MGLSTVEAFKHIEVNDDMVEVSGEKLLRLQAVLASMLADFDSACRKLGVSYTLSGGTCLGAIRHKGFIPWDDDLDVNMTRKDFVLLSEHFEEMLGKEYWLHVPGVTKGYELGFPRIRKKGTILKSREDFDIAECGVYIDIFLIDNIPNGAVLRSLHGFISMGLGFALSCRRFCSHKLEYMRLAGDNPEARSAFKKKALLGLLFSFLSAESWCVLWDRWNGAVRNERSRFLSIPVGRKHYFGEVYERKDFFPVSAGVFEGLNVMLPAHPDPYMKALYGPDYMVPPPEADRERHVVYEFDLGEN